MADGTVREGTGREQAAMPPLADGARADGFSHAEVVRVVTGIMLCILLAAIDQMVVIPALPQIAASLGGFEGISWVVTAYLLTSIGATPVCGKLSDLFGRRPVLIACLVVFCIASAGCALAQSMLQLVLARAVQGLGGAGLLAVSQSAVADVVSPRERGRYQVYMVSMWALASVGGPIAGGYIAESLSWHWIFWMNLPIGLAAIWLADRALKLIPVTARRSAIDWLGSLLLVGGVSGLLLVLHWGGRTLAWTSPEIAALTVSSAVVLGLFVVQERTHAEPLIPPRLAANRVFLDGIAVAFLNSFGLFAVTLLLPVYFQMVTGASAGTAGLLIAPVLGANAAAAFAGGQFTRRTSTTKGVILCGVAASACGFFLLAGLDAAMPLPLVVVAMLLVGAGTGAAMPTVLILVQNAADTRDIGSATGTMMLTRGIGGALGAAVAGAMLAARLGLLGPEAGAGALGSAQDAAAIAELSSGLRHAFAVCGAALLLAVVVAVRMRELPLRGHAAAVHRP